MNLNRTRNTFYNNNYTPHMFTSGRNSQYIPQTWRTHAINGVGQYTPVSIILGGMVDGMDLSLTVIVASESDLSQNDLRLYVATTMDSVTYSGDNGLVDHHHTIVGMLTSNDGEVISLNSQDSIVWNYNWSMDPQWPGNDQVSWDIKNLNIVAFVQDMGFMKEVYQVESSRASELVILKIHPEEERPLPNRVALTRIYPNPFNSHTQINFTLNRDSMVRLTVHNLLGSEVDILLDDQIMGIGNHYLSWQAEGIPSGIYLLRLQTLEGIDTYKMTLLK